MNYDHYDGLKFTEDYHLFLFVSKGPKGSLKKLVVYTKLKSLPNTFNLGLATLRTDENGEEYADGADVSDNGDRNKILATVAVTAYYFADKYPDKKIYVTGIDKVRTRLYQIAISHAFSELSQKFIIHGNKSAKMGDYAFEFFEKGVNYTGFLLELK